MAYSEHSGKILNVFERYRWLKEECVNTRIGVQKHSSVEPNVERVCSLVLSD